MKTILWTLSGLIALAIPARAEEGCGKELDFWFTEAVLHPKPSVPGRQMTMAQLPAACRTVLNAP